MQLSEINVHFVNIQYVWAHFIGKSCLYIGFSFLLEYSYFYAQKCRVVVLTFYNKNII